MNQHTPSTGDTNRPPLRLGEATPSQPARRWPLTLIPEIAEFASARHEWACLLCEASHHGDTNEPEWIADSSLGFCPSCNEPAVIPLALRRELHLLGLTNDDNDGTGALGAEALIDDVAAESIGLNRVRIEHATRSDDRWCWDDSLFGVDIDDIDLVDFDLEALEIAEFDLDDLEWDDELSLEYDGELDSDGY